jgi:lactoylglutathione lyase
MLNFKGFDHININVNNLDKMVQFYQNVFGFEVKEEEIYYSPKYKKEIKYKIIGKSNIGLLALYENGEHFSKQQNINHIGFYIDNFSEDQAKELNQMGIKVEYLDELGGIVDYEKSKSIYIYDPEGNSIEITSVFGGGL